MFAHNLPEPSRAPFADAGVDNDTVDAAQLVAQLGEHLRHLVVVVDVELRHRNRDRRILLRQFGFQLFEAVGSSGAQRQVAAFGGESAGHAGAEAGTCSGDEDFLAGHSGSISIT